MRQAFNEYVESGGTIPDFSNKENDPFWDPPEPVLIGKSYLQLKNLQYTLDCEGTPPIFTTATNIPGGVAGQLTCSYWPCDIGGDGEPDDELLVEEPQELLGKEIFFRVQIEKAANLPNDLCKDVFVTYIMKHEPDVIHRVPAFEGKTQNPVFNFKKVHRIDEVNDYLLEYFDSGNVVFKTYGNPSFGQNMATPAVTASAKAAAAT